MKPREFAEQLDAHLHHVYGGQVPEDARYVLGRVQDWVRSEVKRFRQMPGAPLGVIGKTEYGWVAAPDDAELLDAHLAAPEDPAA